MTDWLLTAAGCLVLIWAGRPWARGLAPARPGRWALRGLSYLCGAALVTLAMLVVAFLGIDLDRVSLGLAVVGVRVAGRFVDRRPPRASAVKGSRAAALVPLTLAWLTLAFGLVEAFRLGPITAIDFLKAWGLKGTAVFVHGNLDFSDLSGPHLFYPLEVSNLNGAFYILLGEVNDTVVRLPAALFGVSLAMVMWWLCRLMLPPAGAALGVALAVMTPEFTNSMTNGLADLPLAAYLTVCVLAAHRWVEDGDDGWAPLSGFAAGAAAWTKLEGALSPLVVLAAVMLMRRAIRTPGAGVWLAWFAVFVLPWQLFQRIHDIPANRSHFKTLYLDLGWIVRHVASTLSETAHWGVFWPLCLGLIALTVPLWWPTEYRSLAALTLPNVVLTLGAWVTHYRAGQADSIEATAHRLYLHLAPTVAVMTAAAATVALSVVRSRRAGPPAEVPTR